MIWRCKTDCGWRQFPATFSSNGRPRKGLMIDGQLCYLDGVFQLRYYENSKMVYKTVGPDGNIALDALHVQENLLKTRAHAAAAGVRIVEDPERKPLIKAYVAFLQAADDRGAAESRVVYRTALNTFLDITPKTYVDELTADDILRYQRHLRQKGNSDRTIYNRWNAVKSFYIFCGLDPKRMKIAAPRYEEKTPEVYEPEELNRFFQSIERDPSLYAAGQIMVKCGLRDKELRYLEWQQLNLNRGVLHVRANPRYGFKVKDCEERMIPVPQKLVEWLAKYRSLYPNQVFVCPTDSGEPNGGHLWSVKRAARRAGLNCNRCKGCEKKGECSRWFLHKFRATCVTMWLRSGMDLRTVMKLSGHADLASVMRYLCPANDESVRTYVNGINWDD